MPKIAQRWSVESNASVQVVCTIPADYNCCGNILAQENSLTRCQPAINDWLSQRLSSKDMYATETSDMLHSSCVTWSHWQYSIVVVIENQAVVCTVVSVM